MKKSVFLNTLDFSYNEYLIVLKPNQDTCDKINSVKKDFSEKYKTSFFHSTGQILMVKFIQREMIEERLLNHLKNISNSYKPFLVKLKDYGSFPSHTIFINIESQLQIRNLVTQLKSAQPLLTLDKENKAHFLDDFYISIATKLLPWQYEKAWLEYNQAHFVASFIADGFTLQKRPVERKSNSFHPNGNYKTAKRFQFTDSPVITTQGELFG